MIDRSYFFCGWGCWESGIPEFRRPKKCEVEKSGAMDERKERKIGKEKKGDEPANGERAATMKTPLSNTIV